MSARDERLSMEMRCLLLSERLPPQPPKALTALGSFAGVR